MTEADITVLHVDDDEDFTDLVGEFLRRHSTDIAIRTVQSGDDALAHLAATDDVDCVISDYVIPGLNGLKLLEAVRDRWPDLPFILYTGRGNEEIAVEAISAGVTDYLEKGSGTGQYAVLANRIRNVVTHHRAETELRRTAQRAEAQFELLVDTVEDYAIFMLDTEGRVQTWNAGAERIKGYTSEEILGEHFSVFYREEDVEDGVPERNLHEAATEGRFRDEGWRVRRDGSTFWADVTITALREGDDLLGYAKVTHDSSQRYHERVLLEQNEQLRDLIAAISHDLRSPLSVAGGNVQLATETGDLSRLEAATRSLERANELLDYLARLAEEGKRMLESEPVALREVAEDAWSVVETEGADLVVEGDPVVVADRQRLQQLLENLLRNAVKHVGSDVTVTVGPLGDEGFYVEDDGPGIPEAERTEVFEMGHSEESEGTGFGLAICRQIAEAHGWFIEVTDGTSGGARFEVSNVEMA